MVSVHRSVLVALSGGMDSAATVLILKDRGYDVAGVTLDLTGDKGLIADAREAADRLGIRLFVEDVKKEFFTGVVLPFVKGYACGETPAPCTICNPAVKWRYLLRTADREGFQHIATGHYVRILKQNGIFYVTRGIDPKKDQSYYLWGLGQEVLSRAMLPLGDLTKESLRGMMSARGFDFVSKRRESMGVCFLGRDGYRPLLEKHGVHIAKGEVLDVSGNVIGSHDGFPLYTTGQKRGLSITGSNDALYVLSTDSVNNTVTAGTLRQLYSDRITLRDFIVPDMDELLGSDKVSIMIRGIGMNPEGYCSIELSGGVMNVNIPSYAYAPAMGQPAVFYIGDRVAGGGIISSWRPANS